MGVLESISEVLAANEAKRKRQEFELKEERLNGHEKLVQALFEKIEVEQKQLEVVREIVGERISEIELKDNQMKRRVSELNLQERKMRQREKEVELREKMLDTKRKEIQLMRETEIYSAKLSRKRSPVPDHMPKVSGGTTTRARWESGPSSGRWNKRGDFIFYGVSPPTKKEENERGGKREEEEEGGGSREVKNKHRKIWSDDEIISSSTKTFNEELESSLEETNRLLTELRTSNAVLREKLRTTLNSGT